MKLQYINDTKGNPLYVLVPIDEFERLTKDDEQYWEDVPYQSDEFDEVTIPQEVVDIMFEKEINVMGAWRIYRKLTQAEVAEKVGITQSALSQMERKSSRPQTQTRELLAKIYDCNPDQLTA